MNYYNENNPQAVEWIKHLIRQRLIPGGCVDDRSICDVQPEDVAGFVQCHWFAGICGWPRALSLAGWPEDRPIWTASCPCQGESVAGRREGKDDPRHLWPDYFRLVRACRPVFQCGEQVARAVGTHWLDGVLTDLETADYTAWAADIPACSVDAPHIRSRLYWLAHAAESHAGRRQLSGSSESGSTYGERSPDQPAGYDGGSGGLGDADSARRQECQRETVQGQGRGKEGRTTGQPDGALRASKRSWWTDAEWLDCHDGKKRRTKSGLPLLVARFPGRVAAWHGIGNSINPILAAEVIKAYMDIYPDD